MDGLKCSDRMSLQELPALFPDDRKRNDMLNALLVTGLIDLRRDRDLTWIYFGSLAPDEFRADRRSLQQAEDPLAGVPQAKVRHRIRALPANRRRVDEE
jgi:hypothetical protein